MPLSQATQDYLKVIFKIRQRRGRVTTSALAQGMGVSAASATNMVKRLVRRRLVRHTPYRTVELTADGEKAALEIIRHHRLLELFLRDHLGLALDQVHGEAETLEHVLSEEVESRIAALMGHPTADPHGDPIPSKAGALADVTHPRLSDLARGQEGRIARVSDEHGPQLRRLTVLGLVPGARVVITDRRPGGVRVRLADGRRRRVPAALARAVFIVPGAV